MGRGSKRLAAEFGTTLPPRARRVIPAHRKAGLYPCNEASWWLPEPVPVWAITY
jgi:hypothetical protein